MAAALDSKASSMIDLRSSTQQQTETVRIMDETKVASNFDSNASKSVETVDAPRTEFEPISDILKSLILSINQYIDEEIGNMKKVSRKVFEQLQTKHTIDQISVAISSSLRTNGDRIEESTELTEILEDSRDALLTILSMNQIRGKIQRCELEARAKIEEMIRPEIEIQKFRPLYRSIKESIENLWIEIESVFASDESLHKFGDPLEDIDV